MPSLRWVWTLILTAAAVACHSPTTPTPDGTPQGGTTGGGTQNRVAGCLGYAATSGQPMCGILPSMGSAQGDQVFLGEIGLQRAFWGGIAVRTVAPLNDCSYQSRNALADPATRDIYFGANLFNSLIAQHGNVLPVAGVLAHEWGHQIQFQNAWQTSPAKAMELEADAFSGYFMALAKGWAWPYMNSYFQTVFDIGDYNFNDAGHHGTPAERHAMARVGFDTALQAAAFGRPLSYLELHGIFTNALFRLRSLGAPTPLTGELVALTEAVATGEATVVLSGRPGRPDQMTLSEPARRRLWPR